MPTITAYNVQGTWIVVYGSTVVLKTDSIIAANAAVARMKAKERGLAVVTN